MVAIVIPPLRTDCKVISSRCYYSVLQITGNKPHITCLGQIFTPFFLKTIWRFWTELDKLSDFDPVSILFPLCHHSHTRVQKHSEEISLNSVWIIHTEITLKMIL